MPGAGSHPDLLSLRRGHAGPSRIGLRLSELPDGRAVWGAVTKRVKRPWRRKNGPCPECASERCRSTSTFACWVRTFRHAFSVHDFVRCGEQSKSLRAAGIPILRGPQPGGNEVVFAPAWAVERFDAFRLQRRREGRRVISREVSDLLKEDPRYGPAPSALLARMDELRAFAVLRGWQLRHGSWR